MPIVIAKIAIVALAGAGALFVGSKAAENVADAALKTAATVAVGVGAFIALKRTGVI